MDKIYNYSDIQNSIRAIKGNNIGFITNFYPEMNKINQWIKEGVFFQEIVGNTLFLLRRMVDFNYLYYCSTSVHELSRSIPVLNMGIGSSQLVVDVIGKHPEVKLIAKAFLTNGFYLYTTLNRMSKNSADDTIFESNYSIKNANDSHSTGVMNLLNEYFDPIAEQLPMESDIKNWISLNHLIVFEEKDEIIGFIIFDILGMTSYLRYWFVHPQHRNKKIGSSLLNEFFSNSVGTKRQLFWVIQTNENAIKRYIHYGFNSENLYDYILTNKKIFYETKNN
jgi:ribosomal protein S18 acetylase RimI-like enzyme